MTASEESADRTYRNLGMCGALGTIAVTMFFLPAVHDVPGLLWYEWLGAGLVVAVGCLVIGHVGDWVYNTIATEVNARVR